MPGYQLALQLLGQAAAFPASAASLLQTKLAEAAAGSAAAVPFIAAVCRQVYLTRAVQSSQVSGARPASGLAVVCGVMERLLREQPGTPDLKQLLLTMLQDSWYSETASLSGCSRSSSGSGVGSRRRSGGGGSTRLLQLELGASQQQLYLCSVVAHLGLVLLSSTGWGTGSSSSHSGSADSSFLGPLVLYLTNPEAAAQQLMLGMPGDEAAQLLNTIVDGRTVYRCACGMPYLVGECGQPTASLRCPSANCPYTLGAISHTPSQGQTLVGQVGQVQERQQHGFISTYVAPDAAACSSTGSSILGSRARTAAGGSAAVAAVGARDLSPSSCQLLRLLVHAALLLGSAAGLQPSGGGCWVQQMMRQHSALLSKCYCSNGSCCWCPVRLQRISCWLWFILQSRP